MRLLEENTKKEDKILEILKMVAPGTELRLGLENILKTKTGALIVIGDSKEVLDIVDGGFFVNQDYSPSNLYELAKMDGAIVLSSDLKKILYANAQLIPSRTIITKETGTRHRTAERTAKETGEVVISISQRRNIITVFKENIRYMIEETAKVLGKANQALQILERYKKVFDNKLNILNEYEFNDIVTLDIVIACIQRAEMVMMVRKEVQKFITELGEDGRLVKMQLDELMGGLDEEELYIVKDYIAKGKRKEPNKVLNEIRSIDINSISVQKIAEMLGYENFENYEEIAVYPRGYRVLNKVPKVPSNVIDNLVKSFKSFQHILLADIESLDNTPGVGEIRSRNIKQSLKRMQEQFVFDNLVL